MKKQSRCSAAVAGLLGGVAGAWAMDQFTRAWQQLVPDSKHISFSPLPYSRQEWDSTSRTAAVAGRYLLGRELSGKEREIGAQVVHFAVGAAGGAVYGMFIGRGSFHPLISGLAFGTALWLFGEEIAMPLLGINNPPQGYSLADHANSLGEHLVYGISTAAVARLLLP